MKKSFQHSSKPSRKKKFGRKNSKKPTQVVSGDKGEDVVATASATRQTTAYLKKLFSEVGFSIDTKKGVPELYFSNTNKPNENTPLGWAESLFIVALHELNEKHLV
mgnify:CR=1 FL=1